MPNVRISFSCCARILFWLLSSGLTMAGAGAAVAQSYPNKPIRIVTGSAGGAADIASRLMAEELAGRLATPIVVDNRVGLAPAGGTVAKAAADGYTLLCYLDSLWIGPLMQDVPYDPIKDFAPISLLGISPGILVVHPSLPVKSVKELIALAKAKPGALNYSSYAVGGAPHLSAELFKAMAGVNIVMVNYKGPAPALVDLMNGQVQLTFANAAFVEPHLKSGRVRALAVTSAQPSALAPNLPTISASGLPGYALVQNTGMFAPGRTPDAIISRLYEEIVRVLRTPATKEKFFNAGIEVVGSSPAELAIFLNQERNRLGKVIKDAGIRID